MDPEIIVTSVSLVELWLPILVSAVLVFIASSILWMVLPHHKADVKKLPDEGRLTSTLREMDLPPGVYMWPNCETHKEMGSEEFKRRFNEGPWGSITVSGKPNFARNLALTFLSFLVVSLFVGYVLSEARAETAAYLEVFQVAGASAFLAYVLGGLPHAIFFARPARFIATEMIDGVVYALLTAGVFAWLWPQPTIPG